MKLRPLFVFVVACTAMWCSAAAVIAQSQGVGLTVEGPAASPGASSAPTPSAGAPSGGTTVPAGSSGVDDGPAVQGTTASPDRGPFPRTGLDVLRLLAIALGSITLGQVLLGWARRMRSSTA